MNTKAFKENVSETLLIPLVCKAEETIMKSPIIKDYVARDILNKLNMNLEKYKNKKISRVGTAIRTKYFDEEVMLFISKTERPIIVMLGCGLDSRYDRLPPDLIEKAFFVYLDFDDVINLRKELIPERINEKYIGGDILYESWVDKVKIFSDKNTNYMFLLEGVVMYIEKDSLKSLMKMLCHNFNSGVILFDTLSYSMSKNSEKHDTIKYSKSKFVFGFDCDRELESWDVHLKYKKTKLFSEFKECRRFGLMTYFLMSFIPKYKNASRMITYKINQ